MTVDRRSRRDTQWHDSGIYGCMHIPFYRALLEQSYGRPKINRGRFD